MGNINILREKNTPFQCFWEKRMRTKIVDRLKQDKIWVLLFALLLLIAVIRFFHAICGDYFTFLY